MWEITVLIQTLRDVSLIILSILSFIMCILPLVAMFFAVRGTLALKRKTHALAPQAQAKVRWAQTMVDQGANKVVTPVVRAHLVYTRWSTTGLVLLRSLRRQTHHSD